MLKTNMYLQSQSVDDEENECLATGTGTITANGAHEPEVVLSVPPTHPNGTAVMFRGRYLCYLFMTVNAYVIADGVQMRGRCKRGKHWSVCAAIWFDRTVIERSLMCFLLIIVFVFTTLSITSRYVARGSV
jgi:hypothetical protein